MTNLLVDIEKYICKFPNPDFKDNIDDNNKKYLDDLNGDLMKFQLSVIDNMNLTSKEINSMMACLIIFSNNLFESLLLQGYKRTPRDNNYSNFVHKKILNYIEETIEKCETFNQQIIADLPLTKYKISYFKPNVNNLLQRIKFNLCNSDVDETLTEVLCKDFGNLVKKKQIIRSEFHFVICILTKLSALKTLSTESIEEFLIGYDYNTPLFYKYCIKKANELIQQCNCLHQQVNVVLNLEDNIINIRSLKTRKFVKSKSSITAELKGFYKEKRVTLMNKIELRRIELLDSKHANDYDRIQMNLSVAQFGLLIRLFIDHNLILNSNIGKIFSFFSSNFSTPSSSFISTDSLQKKSTTVEFSTARKVKGILIEMINWINKNYNTSNYSG